MASWYTADDPNLMWRLRCVLQCFIRWGVNFEDLFRRLRKAQYLSKRRQKQEFNQRKRSRTDFACYIRISKKYYFEDIPISEQCRQPHSAIAGMHGAAPSSLVLTTTAKLIELFHPGYVVDMYRNMANAVWEVAVLAVKLQKMELANWFQARSKSCWTSTKSI